MFIEFPLFLSGTFLKIKIMKHIINGFEVEVNEAGVHFYTKTGMITVAPFDAGISLNCRNIGTTLKIKQNDHLADVIIVERDSLKP